MQQMEKQAKGVGTEIITDMIKSVDFSKKPFTAVGDGGQIYTADSVIISTGAQARWLGLESEKKFSGFGVSACDNPIAMGDFRLPAHGSSLCLPLGNSRDYCFRCIAFGNGISIIVRLLFESSIAYWLSLCL